MGSSKGGLLIPSSPKQGVNKGRRERSSYLPTLLIKSMATQKPLPSATRTVSSGKKDLTISSAVDVAYCWLNLKLEEAVRGEERTWSAPVFPLGERGPRNSNSASPSVKLLTRVEQLRLLTKAEKAGLLSLAEKLGFSLSQLRSGVSLQGRGAGRALGRHRPWDSGYPLQPELGLLVLGPTCVYLVPEEYPWEVALQVVVALVCVAEDLLLCCFKFCIQLAEIKMK
ncbi:unnamed protein product [Thlaspi arvense]|uniref:Uncharacterized protein n=1 Tax=Thlaspi arvense TaxID=13288 RepID=A0AAU9SQ87_THLAR|nr:unnamed protein product [Thlaspi arvense]